MSPRPLLLRLACSLASPLVLLGALAHPRAAQEDPDPGRFFALPLAREARTLAEQAREHLRTQRWGEGIASLQRLLEEHEAEVLPDSYRKTANLLSVHKAHPGAARWAREELLELPADARDLYRDRYEARAQAAFDRARTSGDRRALVVVAHRWPLTHAAVSALWTLSDLELEEGHAHEALVAWNRASDLSTILGAGVPKGAEARRELAFELLESRATPPPATRDRDALFAATDPSERRGPLPSREAEPWACQLDLEPFDRNSDPTYYHNLFPVLTGDRVLVGSTLRLFSVDAFTGELLWTAGPPDGWARLTERKRALLFKGINRFQLAVEPAVGGRVAVAAMQIPYSEEGTENWQGIEIMRAIAQRRLFAYDVETGRELWNHAPELEWIPTSTRFQKSFKDTYAQRMLVASPPVVAGSRVIVPCYRMQGRIDYHVACYELETGALLWSTSVVSGQRPRNMFGRARQEFAASPLTVAGDRVIAQTDLGTVAALDLMTGELLWESLYRQIALPKTRTYQTPRRPITWRLTAPSVVDRLVISTPSDSDEICAFDLDDGRVLWSFPERLLRDLDPETRDQGFNVLLGADPDTLYLGGSKVAALLKPGGLRSPLPFESLWTHSIGDERTSDSIADRMARAVLCRNEVLLPMRSERIVLDRRTGIDRRHLSGPWEFAQYGNAVVNDGVIFTLTRESLHGFFDWEALFDRQRRRLAAAPDDPGVGLDTARLYARRAEAVLEDGELFAALGLLRSAREILEPLTARLDTAGEGETRLSRRVTEELHRVLRHEAHTLERQGHRTQALQSLERARTLAQTRTDLRDTLLHQERILRDAHRSDTHLAVLGELELRCSDLPLPEGFGAEDASALAGLQRHAPNMVEHGELDLPVGLWVLFTRAEAYRRARRFRPAMDDWHTVLRDYDEHELADRQTAGALARVAIGRELLSPDGRAAYEHFEREAAEMFGGSVSTGDVERLQQVSLLYPHSRAALEADRARLDLAYERDDVDAVAAIVYSMLSSPGRDRAAERLALLRLGRTMGRLGNADLERGLLTALAREAPGVVSNLEEHGARTLAELARDLGVSDEAAPPLTPRFDERVLGLSNARTGSHRFIGRLLRNTDPESAPEELHTYLADDRIEAFSNLDVERPAWSYLLREPVAGASSCAVADGRVVVGGRTSILAVDDSGSLAWIRGTGGLPVQYLGTRSGVVVALVGSSNPERVLAFDAHGGIPLWEMHLGSEGRWRAPIFGPGRVVLFSQVYSRPARAQVVDLFRGTPVAEAQLGMILNNNLDESAWVAGENLLIPDFTHLRSRSRVTAYNLETGAEEWSRELPDGEVFHSVAHHDGEDYLITLAEAVGGGGGVHAFDAQLNTLRRIVPLRVGEEPIGLRERKRTELPAPYLFTYTKTSSDRGVPVRAIHLPYQVRWNWSLPVAHQELYDNDVMPIPAVSDTCVAFAFVTKHPTTGLRGDATMMFVDKNSGKTLDRVLLDEEFAHADRLEVRGLGEALFVVGHARNPRRLRMQILERAR